jgi:hypothetical protein
VSTWSLSILCPSHETSMGNPVPMPWHMPPLPSLLCLVMSSSWVSASLSCHQESHFWLLWFHSISIGHFWTSTEFFLWIPRELESCHIFWSLDQTSPLTLKGWVLITVSCESCSCSRSWLECGSFPVWLVIDSAEDMVLREAEGW